MTKTSKTKTAGDKIGSLRKKKKISLEELSQKTGLTLSHLKNIEEGKEFAPVWDIFKNIPRADHQPGRIIYTGKKKREGFKGKEGRRL